MGCEQVATCFLGPIGGAGILAAMRLIVSVVTPLAEGLEIARVAVLGHVIHMRDGQNYPHDPQRSYVITVAPSLRAFLRPFEAQAIVAKRPRLVPDSSRRPSAKLVVGNAAELAAIARAFTNSGADDWPVFRVSRAVFSLDRHHTRTALQTAVMAALMNSAATCGTMALPAARCRATRAGTPLAKSRTPGSIRRLVLSAPSTGREEDQKERRHPRV